MKTSVFLLSYLLIIIYRIFIVVSLDTITQTQFLKDTDTIISSNGTFELGFFNPGESKNWYIGIWYKKISEKTVVWVANREIPITNKTGSALKITNGVLILVNATNNIIWISPNITTRSSYGASPLNPVAQLLDSGNLVIKDENDTNPEFFIWQSFDHPTDTHLPGMKFSWSFKTGVERYLTTWKSSDDPGPGEFAFHLDPKGYPQIILKKGQVEKYRTGPWNGVRFSGRPDLKIPNTIYKHGLVFNQENAYYIFELVTDSVITRFTVNQSVGQRWLWVNPTHSPTQGWVRYLTSPTDDCDDYARCGPNSLCNIATSPGCFCLTKFVPRFPDNWAVGDWSSGCLRNTSLNCERGDVFFMYNNVKLPDTRSSWFNASTSLKECKEKCLNNCSCTAYANLDIRDNGSGCLLWFNELIDIRDMGEAGQDMYVRMASSELDFTDQSNLKKKIIIAVSSLFLVGLVLLGLRLSVYASIKKAKLTIEKELEQDYSNNGSQNEDLDIPIFGLSAIANATNNFSICNKLGEGGFGPVYMGVLEDGQQIAVKRLSKSSRQGFPEFKNEVRCIAKLQHRNLVKLLGYCIQGDEYMLIYEFMPNTSLETFIFDETWRRLVDWPKRFHIINGIARGLLYLHQDSRLRIIHRDLKASNILLDYDMNPKISDFGLARIFGGNETATNTRRVVGTFGYMSPEYAADGLFSVKSDVFSFGVLVLEIVSGKRNKGFVHQDHRHNLLGHAWRLHLEGKSLQLMDEALGTVEECCICEVQRSIQVGLLCVQQSPEDRPNMLSVVLMLSSEGPLRQPKQPGFYAERKVVEVEYTSRFSHASSSCNEITNTTVHGR